MSATCKGRLSPTDSPHRAGLTSPVYVRTSIEIWSIDHLTFKFQQVCGSFQKKPTKICNFLRQTPSEPIPRSSSRSCRSCSSSRRNCDCPKHTHTRVKGKGSIYAVTQLSRSDYGGLPYASKLNTRKNYHLLCQTFNTVKMWHDQQKQNNKHFKK